MCEPPFTCSTCPVMAFAYSEAADAPEQPDVIAFSAWIDAAVTENRGEDLIQYRRVAKRG